MRRNQRPPVSDRAWRKVMRVVCAAILLGVSGLLTTACTPEFIEQNQTTLLMRVTDIVGNAASADDGDILLSDVSDGFNDDATVTVDLARKNPIVGVSTPLEDVRLERYEVRFFRT